MTRKHVIVAISILIGIGTVLFLFGRSNLSTNIKNLVLLTPERKVGMKADRWGDLLWKKMIKPEEHHISTWKEWIAVREAQPISTWEEWVEARTEIMVGSHKDLETLAEIEALQQRCWAGLAEIAEQFKAAQMRPPKTAVDPSPAAWTKVFQYEALYHGPQTSEALLAEFDEEYLKMNPKSVEWDTDFPREEFLQRFLDKGFRFTEYLDYSSHLDLRRELIQLKDNPDEWLSGSRGIPITTNFEEYLDGYIDRKIWEHNIVRKVAAENPGNSVLTVFFPRSHPDKYLPVAGKVMYVRRRPNSSGMVTWGASLTQEQRDDILYRGKHPEDREIVYVDEDYNVLSEKPKPYNHEEWLKAHTYDYVPEGLRAPDGTIVTPERYAEIVGRPMPPAVLQRYETYAAAQSSGDAREAMRAAAREAAEAERAKFEQGLRELERLMSMSDAEIAAELERRFTPQPPELPTDENLENRLWSEIQPNRLTPARFEAAFRILEQYGPEAGMHRLHTADPKLAAQVRLFFGQPPAERPPEKPNTAESSQPPEAPPERR